RGPGPALRGLLDRGLEPTAQVENEVGVTNLLDVLRGELHVVRLGARRRQIGDVNSWTADLRRHPRERVEGGHDRLLAGCGRVARAPAARRRQQKGGRAGEQAEDVGRPSHRGATVARHENGYHYRSEWRAPGPREPSTGSARPAAAAVERAARWS